MSKSSQLLVVLVALYLGISIKVDASTLYWIGTSSNNNWNNASNWSPNSVPGVLDDVIFDGGGLFDCIINVPAICNSLTVSNLYTGTITQNALLTIGQNLGPPRGTVGDSNWNGGTFIGGSANIINYGNFNLGNTTFTSTSGTLSVGNDFNFSGGSFIHNNGTVLFDFTLYSQAGLPTLNLNPSAVLDFYNVSDKPNFGTLNFNGNSTVNINGNFTLNANGAFLKFVVSSTLSLTVVHDLLFTGDSEIDVSSGTINVQGDITSTNTSSNTGNSSTGATLNINGGGTQILTGSGTIHQGSIPCSVNINKPSGTLNLVSYITIACDSPNPSWTYVSGGLNQGTSTVCFYQLNNGFTVAGNHQLNDVRLHYTNVVSPIIITGALTTHDFTIDTGGNSYTTLTVSSSVTVNGTFYYGAVAGSGAIIINTGTVNIKGDIINNSTATNCDGSGTFVINGSTGDQNVYGAASADQGAFPFFNISKTTGTGNLYFFNYLTFVRGFTWTVGTVVPGSSTCVFADANTSQAIQTVSASATGMSFNNIQFEQTVNSSINNATSITTDISVLGNFIIKADCGVNFNNNNVSIGGDFTSLTTNNNGATKLCMASQGVFTFNGTSQQKITCNNNPDNLQQSRANFSNIVFNNSANRSTNDDIVLNDVLVVWANGSVTFTKGMILSTADFTNPGSTTGSNKYLRIRNGATVNNYSNPNSFVNGPVACEFNSPLGGTATLYFPVGDAGVNRYMSLVVTQGSGSGNYMYLAGIVHGQASSLGGYSLPGTIDRVSGVRYIQFARYKPSTNLIPSANFLSNATLTVSYGTDDFVTNSATLKLAQTPYNVTGPPSVSNGTSWFDLSGTATGSPSGTITATLVNQNTGLSAPYSSVPILGGSQNPGSATAATAGNLGVPIYIALADNNGGGNPLPIKLISFDAKNKNKIVEVVWETATEINSDFFEVYRSYSGNAWEKIKQVKAKGFSNQYCRYQVYDSLPFSGISYYQLKEVDTDGESNYSNVRAVEVHYDDVETFPNPVNNELTIISENLHLASIRIFDAVGIEYTEKCIIKSRGPSMGIVFVNELPNQLYILKMSNGFSVKFLKN